LLQIALNSLESQLHKKFEVIIVNDAPGTYLEIKSIIDEYHFPIKYLENVRNLGAGESRNVGIKNASGDFVCFLDSDDFFLPDKLSEQLFLMLATQAEISHTSYFARSSLNTQHTFSDTSHHSGNNQVQFIAAHGCSIATPTVMIKKSLLAKIPNPFPNSHSAGEDISAWLTLLNASSGPLQHLVTPLTIVRTHVNSAANNARAQIESKILINQTLKALGIEGFPRIESGNRSKNPISIRFQKIIMRVFSQIYLRMPLQVRSFLKKNSLINYLHRKLQ
jgi:glycosyltransferase involved in cell wall biosynthesis